MSRARRSGQQEIYMKILITGGCGYIGAHLTSLLAAQGHIVHVVDRDSGSANLDFVGHHAVIKVMDLCAERLHSPTVLSDNYDAVVHLAADISVEESTRQPLKYWNNNIKALTSALEMFKTPHFIFASTGTAFQPENPYSMSKVAGEQIVHSAFTAPSSTIGGYTIFRFYNVSGMEPGIRPTGQPTHLIRRAAMAAKGIIPSLTVYGTDYDTRDGTCIRDYIHVVDLVASIANAVEGKPANTPYECLATGSGSTVLEVVESMKRVSGTDFGVIMAERRPGDSAVTICPSQYAGISISKTLDDMCLDAYTNL